MNFFWRRSKIFRSLRCGIYLLLCHFHSDGATVEGSRPTIVLLQIKLAIPALTAEKSGRKGVGERIEVGARLKRMFVVGLTGEIARVGLTGVLEGGAGRLGGGLTQACADCATRLSVRFVL